MSNDEFRRRRETAGLTLHDLSARSGVAIPVISQYERGDRTLPEGVEQSLLDEVEAAQAARSREAEEGR